jgi:hypothetical protein
MEMVFGVKRCCFREFYSDHDQTRCPNSMAHVGRTEMTPFQPAPSRSLAFKAHAALWSVAGLASALYVGWMVSGPAIIETGTFKSDRRPAADGRGLETAMSQLSSDVRALHGKIATNDDNTHTLLGRVAALEEKGAFVTASASPPSPPVSLVAKTDNAPPALRASDSKPQVAAAAPRSSEITTGAILQRTVSQPGIPPTFTAPTAPTPERSVPGAVATTPLQSTETSPVPAKSALGLQLSTGPNLDSLRLNWSLLHERHRDLLGPMQTRYRKVAGKPNAPYQLIAGPVRSQADAARICKALAGSGVSCRATTYSGEAL